MKRFVACILLMGLALSFCACAVQERLLVVRAKAEIRKVWEEMAPENEYLEVRSTRVIHIKDGNENEYFHNVDCIVEFVLYSDYMGAAPYYENVGAYDTVVFYKDGTCKVPPVHPIRNYRVLTYQIDYSDFLESVEDLGTSCNGVLIS